jgi:hypothetical protein
MINPFDKHLTFLLLEIMWEKSVTDACIMLLHNNSYFWEGENIICKNLIRGRKERVENLIAFKTLRTK